MTFNVSPVKRTWLFFHIGTICSKTLVSSLDQFCMPSSRKLEHWRWSQRGMVDSNSSLISSLGWTCDNHLVGYLHAFSPKKQISLFHSLSSSTCVILNFIQCCTWDAGQNLAPGQYCVLCYTNCSLHCLHQMEDNLTCVKEMSVCIALLLELLSYVPQLCLPYMTKINMN